MSRLKAILRLSVKETAADRETALEELRAGVQEELSRGGTPTVDLGEVGWDNWLIAAAQLEGGSREGASEGRNILAKRLGCWRRETRKRSATARPRRRKVSLGYRLSRKGTAALLGWSLRGRAYGEINRLDRQQRGTFAVRLLEHIAATKEDRVKAGSDLIVQAARGMARQSEGLGEVQSPAG